MIQKRSLYCLFFFLSFSLSLAFQQKSLSYIEIGEASYYAKTFHGRPTASGALYSSSKLTAAHRTLPFGTIIKVTNLKNKREILVEINDRGPFVPNRIIDLSLKAARALHMVEDGVAKVKLEVITPASSSAITDAIE